MKTTYIVSGHMRTGTSMMMRALEAGGLQAAKNEESDKWRRSWQKTGYEANPGGFYELRRQDYKEAGFPKRYEGQLIKVLYGALPKIAVMKYKIVFMMRDVAEIEKSYEALFRRKIRIDPAAYSQWMKDTLEVMNNRKDCKISVLQYRDVIEKPLDTFLGLRASRWPIDAEAAAATIDEKLYRHKK